MSAATMTLAQPSIAAIPRLENGDSPSETLRPQDRLRQRERLTYTEFERRYHAALQKSRTD